MSAKWRQSKAWDDRVFPSWAWPIKWTLRAFSSIWLAVILLSMVLLYGVLASVPVGLLARIPTLLIDGVTLLAMLGVGAVLPLVLLHRSTRLSGGVRFAVTFLGGAALIVLITALWAQIIWPHLKWNPNTGEGFMLFPEFCSNYASITLRRLPAFEMTEPAFYAWWPMRLILLLFVINMIVATVRRIEFNFPNIGVLTVHTGIVVLALGSIYYQSMKQEGDVLLINGAMGGDGGPFQVAFHDREDVALLARMRGSPTGWEQFPLRHLPRYNDYGIAGANPPLDLHVLPARRSDINPSVRVDVTGYVSYAELQVGWDSIPVETGDTAQPALDLALLRRAEDGQVDGSFDVIAELRMPVANPADRIASIGGVLAIEHVPQSQDERWRRLSMDFVEPGRHALIIETRDQDTGEFTNPQMRIVGEGDVVQMSGYELLVEQLAPTPPFPIITPGYEGASSSVAVVRIQAPDGEVAQRYVYHRFPELDQEILANPTGGRPIRRNPRDDIRISYLDSTMLQIYIRSDGETLLRLPGGLLRDPMTLKPGDTLPFAPEVALQFVDVIPNVVKQERPIVTPVAQRERDLIGTHGAAAIRVEVSTPDGWSESVWIPHQRYQGLGDEDQRSVRLPDGRTLDLAFTRLVRPLPGFALQLVDFEMIPYDHSEVPRDYISLVRVLRDTGEQREHVTRLNRPLIVRVPYEWDDRRPFLANALARAVSVIAPNRYKLSQSGWDSEGWRQSIQRVRAGQQERPRAAFTILGVGNNPGIHIIAAGGVLMSVGIPWAFYIKPLIMRRRREKIRQEALAEQERMRQNQQHPEPTEQEVGAPA